MGEFASQFFSPRGINLFDGEDLFYSVTLGDTRSPPGGYSGFQGARMIEWGQKSNANKSLDQNLTPQKIPYRISEP